MIFTLARTHLLTYAQDGQSITLTTALGYAEANGLAQPLTSNDVSESSPELNYRDFKAAASWASAISENHGIRRRARLMVATPVSTTEYLHSWESSLFSDMKARHDAFPRAVSHQMTSQLPSADAQLHIRFPASTAHRHQGSITVIHAWGSVVAEPDYMPSHATALAMAHFSDALVNARLAIIALIVACTKRARCAPKDIALVTLPSWASCITREG